MVFGVVILTNYLACAQNTLSLKQCVESAIANNPIVKQSDVQLQNASVNLRQARDNQLPDLLANLNHGINQGRSIDPFTNGYVNQNISYGNYNIGTNITVYNGSELKNLVKQNKLIYEADKMDVQQVKDNLTLSVILAYLQVLTNDDLLTQSNNQLLLTQKEVDRLTILNNQGAIVPAQLYDLKGQLGNDQLALINVQNALATAKISLCQLMNTPYDKTLKVQPITAEEYASAYDGDPNKIYQLAVSQLAVVKAARLRRQSANASVQVANGEFYPRIGFGAGLSTNYSSAATKSIFVNSIPVPSGDFVTVGGIQIPVITSKSNYNTQKVQYFDQFSNNYSTSVNLNIRIPIVNGFQAKNKVALAKNDVKNYQYQEEVVEVQLRQAIELAYVNMVTSGETYITLLQQVSDFNQSFHSAGVRFEAGASTQVEYLIAKNNADRAQINLISARYDYILRRKILDYYQGKFVL